jgi:hypothetical protein
LDNITTHNSLSSIRRGFAPSFVNDKKGCTRLAAASDKVYQLLAHGRWFSPGTPASSTTKTDRHDIVEKLLNVALKKQKSNQSKSTFMNIVLTFPCIYLYLACFLVISHRSRRSRDRMAVGFTTTYAIRAYHVICVCLRIMVSNTYCVFVLFVFVLCAQMLPVSLDCPFLIAPLGFL